MKSELNKLIRQYELFFKRETKIEPLTARQTLQRRLMKLKTIHQRHTFKLGQIRQKFQTYSGLWDRQIQELLKL